MLLRRFLKGPLPEDWGQLEPPKPDPGDCENCPACSVLHGFPPEIVKRIENYPKLAKMARNRAGTYCFGGAYWLGSGKKKDRPKKISPKVRAACPLR
jgi:hypothetical protein